MNWFALIASTAVVSAIVSAFVQWLTGLHRERIAARRDKLFTAVADLLAAETIRWEQDDRMTRAMDTIAVATSNENPPNEKVQDRYIEAKALYEPAEADAVNALLRVRLISQKVYEAGAEVVNMTHPPANTPEHRFLPETRPRAVEALVDATRRELQFAPSWRHLIARLWAPMKRLLRPVGARRKQK
jgi:hypothetical protein